MDESNIFTLKYRPKLLTNFSLDSFVSESLQNSDKVKPYLESSDCDVEEGDSSEDIESVGVKEINRENYQKTLNDNKLTIIAVFARKC